jgi:sterol desaturase/sphingolipid hydroxylase (fatty acid hydroxylase superfamily)
MYIAYCIRFLSYGKSIKHTTVLKKWGLRRILDTTGWNLLFTNQCISLLSLLECKQDVFIVHFISIAIGHLNHANRLGLAFLKYIFNNPKMHIWHHSKKPNKYRSTLDFVKCMGLYFKTNYIPKDGRDIELGFNDENEFPHDFIKQGLSLKK